MTEKQAFADFLSHFNDKNKDGKIQRTEWNDFYSAVSYAVEDDELFVHMMRLCWKLD